MVVDSELLANGVLADLLTELGHPTSREESIRDYLGGTIAGVRQALRARTGRDLPAHFEDTYHERLFVSFSDELRPVPGIRAVLDGLDVPYCLASSGTEERIVRSLTVTGLLDYFADRIFSAERVAAGKPAPDLFLHAAAAMGAVPERCVVVEDSPLGLRAGHAAGMTVLGYVALTPPERLQGADATFASMDELPALLQRFRRGTPSR